MKYKLIFSVTILFLFFTSFLLSKDEINGDINKGKELFTKNCTACHAMGKQLIGPDLTGLVSRIEKEQNLGRNWLQKWITNNSALRASGDRYANEIFKKYNKAEMQDFLFLTEQDVDDILTYIEDPTKITNISSNEVNNSLTNTSETNDISSTNQNLFFIAFLSIVGLLIWIASKLNTLVILTQEEQGIYKKNISYINLFNRFIKRNQKIFYVIYGAVGILLLYIFWASLFSIGVDKGYKPEQPIYFSHKIHSGINQIDCQLCHSSAKYGQVSGIPSLNTCMNCHRTISEYKGEYIESGKTKEFYDTEIKKIYDYVGWDEPSQSYSRSQIPIKWIRIHNMPDFVHFNHAQHVVIGEKTIINSHNIKYPNDQINIVCKACHGKIDTMNVVEMSNYFTMGWCIDCHRTTNVDMNNNYNANYFNKLHDKINANSKKQGTDINIDAIGGLECAKCHY